MKANIFKTEDYKQFIQHVKQTIQTAQIKAAISVNRELLNLYWNMAKQIVEKQKQTAWGDGFVVQMSLDLKAEFPDMKGFSERNIKYIRQWFLFYNANNEIGQQVVAQLTRIPWGHNIAIISKCKNIDEAITNFQTNSGVFKILLSCYGNR